MRKRILHVVTNVGLYQGYDKPTGLWLSELTNAYDIFEAAGYAQDIVSPQGGRSPLEPRSLKVPYLDLSAWRRLRQPAFMRKLDDTLKAADVDASRYAAIFFTGGHGVMWDYPNDVNLQRLAREIHESGGVVAAVCHGFCGLLNVKLTNGDYLIQDRKITGYSWNEEILAGVSYFLPYNVEAVAKSRRADYRKGLLPFVPKVVADGRLITGQNPFATKATARKVLQTLACN